MKESWVLPWMMMMMMMNTAVIMIRNGLYHYSICLDHYSLFPWRCADLPILVSNAHLYRCAWCQAWKSPVCLRSLATIKPLLGCNGVLEQPIFVTKKIVVKMAYFQFRKLSYQFVDCLKVSGSKELEPCRNCKRHFTISWLIPHYPQYP